MFACLHVPDFPAQALFRCERDGGSLNQSSIVILDGPDSLLRVIALSTAARNTGIEIGITKLQAESYGPVVFRKRSQAEEHSAQAALIDCACAFSPHVESTAPGVVTFDLQGTTKLFGSPQQTASRIVQKSREFGFDPNVALASDPDTAMYAALGWEGITVIPAGEEERGLAGLPINVLSPPRETLDTLESWGVNNFKSLAALPQIAIVERLGQEGLHLQKLARGQTLRTLILVQLANEFVESFEFDDPVETLESLTFILNRLVQQLCMRLTARSLATNELRLALELEARQLKADATKEAYERAWKLPLPMADARVLVRLVCLDLDAITFSAPVKKITLQAIAAKPRPSQSNLFAPASPQAEQLEITLARLRGIVGATDDAGVDCVGAPQVLDSHKPDSFRVRLFSTEEMLDTFSPPKSFIAMRIFRPALETIVELRNEKPSTVMLGKRPQRVLAASGPWSNSGQWWKRQSAWARDEWDVALKVSSGIGLYRIYLDRIQRRWFIAGMFD